MILGQSAVDGKELIVLDFMRRNAKSWIIKIVLGGIIIVFVLVFGWSGPPETGRGYVAEVNGTPIERSTVRTLLNMELKEREMRYGSVPRDVMANQDELQKQIIEELVNETLILQEAQRLGITVTDKELVDAIKTNPMFVHEGTFNPAIYNAFLRKLELNPAAYEYLLRRNLIEQKVRHLLTDSVKADPLEVRRFWHFQNDKLVLETFVVKAAAQDVQAPTDEQLEAYYKENQQRYEIPASVDVKYVAVSWKDLAEKMEITDEEAKEYFLQNPREFIIPEKILLRHILLKVAPDADEAEVSATREKIESLRKRISNTEEFIAAAKEESEDLLTNEQGGKLGYVERGSLNALLENVAFELETGVISEPVRSPMGFHLLLVEEKKPQEEIPFEDAKKKIVEKLLEQRARNRISTVMDEFYERVYRTWDLDAPAQEQGFEIKSAEKITAETGVPVAEIPADATAKLVDLTEGDISTLIHAGDTFFVAEVTAYRDARIPELSEIRPQVREDLLNKLAREKAQETVRKIINALDKDGATPEQIAEKFDGEWKQLDAVSRTSGRVPELGDTAEVKQMLTTVTTGAPLYPEPIPTDEGAAVVRLVRVDRAPQDKYEREADTFKKWIVEVRKQEFFTGWLKDLAEKAEIKRYGKAS